MSNLKHIKLSVLKGFFWISISTFLSRVVSFLSLIILAKILTPEDFGIIGYGFLIVGSIGLLREMGFSSALIYQKKDIEKASSTAITIVLIWTIFLYILTVLISPLIADFFRESKLEMVLNVLSITLIFNSLTGIPLSLMEKELKFKKRILPEITNQILYGIVTVIFALLGFRYWSFVIGVLISDFIQMILAFILHPVRFTFQIDIKSFKELFKFGKNVTGMNIINFGIHYIDDFFVGRMLGTIKLGIYNFAYRIANFPATNITNVLNKVLYPGFNKIADNIELLKNSYLKSFEYTTFISIPITFYIIVIIPEVIASFFPNWIDAIIPIQIIAIYGGLRAIGTGLGSVFLSKGKPEQLLIISLLQLSIQAILLYPSIHYLGIIGACWVIVFAKMISITWNFIKLKRLINIKLSIIVRILFKISFVITISILITELALSTLRYNWQYFTVISKIVLIPLLFLIISLLTIKTPQKMLKEIKSQ